MNKERELNENNFNYQDMVEEEIEMNQMCLYEVNHFVQQPKENKNFTLINIINYLNLNDNNIMQIGEDHY